MSKAFRQQCLELALQQLSIVFAELYGLTGRELRFDPLAVERLIQSTAQAFANVLRTARVESMMEEVRELVSGPLKNGPHRFAFHFRAETFELQRQRLVAAGLTLDAANVNVQTRGATKMTKETIERAGAVQTRAPKALPDESEVDPSKIPYGQAVLTKQGRVCSSQPAPYHYGTYPNGGVW